jgi:hypothetical protein
MEECEMPNNFAQEAQDIVHRNLDSVHYFVEFGSPLEKAIAEIFLEAAGKKE